MNEIYRKQVALLIRVMPLVFRIKDFAVHGGTAINLFHRNLNRYSVDIESKYSSVRWKIQNIQALKKKNPQKHKEGVDKLVKHFRGSGM